ncbi:MAG TPA: c-type cytochrome, partial [Cyclobacteriaceae bacterium]
MHLVKRSRTKNNIRLVVLLLLSFALHTEIRSQKLRDSIQAFNNGKKLFRTYCSSCHGIHHENIGPLLASITKKRSRQWVIQFIKNSQFVITGKDEYAKALYSAYNHVMPSFG